MRRQKSPYFLYRTKTMSIKVQNITKIYGEQKALNKVSFEIKTGEIVGFLGPNGAGKSTMMKIITGFIPQNEGQVFVNELDINKNNLEVKKEIGYLPEHNPLYLEMYVKEYLYFVAGIYKIKNKKQKLIEIIEKTGLTIEQNKKISALSKGYRQRVGLAQALIHNPKVLILDEPTSGLDPNQIIEIRNLIAEVGKEKTVLLSTHIMQEVEALCDRVIILNKGSIVADDLAKNIHLHVKKDIQNILVEFDKEINPEKLKEIKDVLNIKYLKKMTYLVQSKIDTDVRSDIFNFAMANDIKILSLQKQEKTLENIFQELTKE